MAVSQISESHWCNTIVKTFKCNFTWIIQDFSLCENETQLISSSFSANDSSKWHLRVDPKGGNEETKDFLSLYLVLDSHDDKTEVRAKYKFAILNDKGDETEISQGTNNFQPNSAWGFRKFIHREYLFNKTNGLLSDDRLTLTCLVSILGDIANISGPSNIRIPGSKLSIDLGNLLETKEFSDVTLTVADHEYKAHKSILSARSKVFSAMFAHKTVVESQSNRVNITDIEHDVLEEMLRFIYTGEVANLDEMADALLAASDKYELGRLKIICEHSLCNNLSIENAADTLILADLYCAGQLKQKTMQFINSHITDVINTEGWKSMITLYSHLVTETLQSISSKF